MTGTVLQVWVLCGLYSMWCEMMVCGRLLYGYLYHQGPGHRHDWHGAAGVCGCCVGCIPCGVK